MSLGGKHIILGVTGGIAAYKSAELVRLLKKSGAEVQVLMTSDAARFITPLTLGTLSEREILSEIFPENESGSWTKHVNLGLWADLFVIAPATAQTIAKLAHGMSDSMLTATALAARCPLLVCPAMDHDMFIHPATQRNLEILESYGYRIMAPEHGELASGLIGHGRLPDPASIVSRISRELAGVEKNGPLAGRTVLVTAGPTREPIDPVRFISNHSSGRMGFAVAEVAADRGAKTILVTGPTRLETPKGIERIDVTTAGEMFAAVDQHRNADIVVMTAAVADYTPAEPADHKLKKSEEQVHLRLKRTTDILQELGKSRRSGQVLVGFALETRDGLANARVKLKSKNLDLIVLNNPLDEGAAFGHETNRVTLLYRNGTEEALGKMSKLDVGRVILQRVETMMVAEATPSE
ncbi:MAG: bifunctional phosphopantothenoylcysteine decarboxylase/phosphopantothenate--cysteine ligase CoaBC [Rhodothermia bacterium]|nr:bifunctional phosphopantothenoylcysteine decarboxylase/phosphopantothenate--cysteine ligase CoaBC [Rhodothermia bacterium]